MTTTMKVALGTLIAAVIAFLLWLASYVSGVPVTDPSPTPVPSISASPLPSPSPSVAASPTPLPSPSPSPQPSPSPTPSPSPIPSPSPSPTSVTGFVYSAANRDNIAYAPTQSLFGSRGEVVPFILTQSVNATGCQPLPQPSNAGISLSYYKMLPYVTTAASFQGARIGSYLDALSPVTSACPGDQVWVDLQITVSLSPGVYPVLPGQTLTVWKMTMPSKPTFPLYAELQGFSAMLAQGYPSSSNVSIQGPVTAAYAAVYRAHRVEPIKQAVVGLNTGNVDTFASSGGSFRQLVLTGAIAPPCIFGPAGALSSGTTPQSAASLQYAETLLKSGDIPVGSYGYVEDEGTDATVIASWLANYQTNAPDLLRMITHTYSTTLLANTFVTNLNSYSGGTIQWGYVSCSAQGTCANTATPGAWTGTPMFVIDAPTSHARAFPWVLGSIGAKAGLYYNFTQAIQTAWTNQYFFGGNGDGTLLYPSTQLNPPVASVRLKQLRQGSFDQEYLAWAKTTGIALGLVTDVKHWNQGNASYEAARVSLGNQLNAAP